MVLNIDYAWAERELRGNATREILCPECSANRKAGNRKKLCFGLRVVGDGRITYACQNCDAHGVLTRDWSFGEPRQRRYKAAAPVVPIKPIDDGYERDMAERAQKIWRESTTPDGTLAERYWRARFGPEPVPFPPTVRFNPSLYHEGTTQAGLVSAFGSDVNVNSIQRTFLKPDGSWYDSKMAMGAHKGVPMLAHHNPDGRGLVIAEGLEKAVAAGYALNVDAWAAAGLHFMVPLAESVPSDTDCVTIIVDQGNEALQQSTALALELVKRNIDYRAVRLEEDPDDILRVRGVDELRAAIDDPANVVRLEDKRSVPKGVRLLSEREALALRQPQDWLIEGVLEKGYLYALTARSGSGKTAMALLISYLISAPDFFPRLFGAKEVEQGNVVYLAGENPVDTIRRMAGLRGHYGLQAEANLSVVMGRFSIKDSLETIAGQIPQDRPLSLVIVDTSAFFFEGEEENNNAAMATHAGVMRALTQLPGHPCCVVLAHPSKFAKESDELIPRGGSAFYNEIDANLTLSPAEGEAIFTLGHTKLRGPDFEKMQVELVRYTDTSFVDTKGRPSSTVVAKILTDTEADAAADLATATERKILDCLAFTKEGMTNRQLAETANMHKGTVSKVIAKLMGKRPPKVEKEGSLFKLANVSGKNGNKKKQTATDE